MANDVQLTLFKQGVDAWNAWRQENDSIRIDLRGADLSVVDLCEADLREADLYGADGVVNFLRGLRCCCLV